MKRAIRILLRLTLVLVAMSCAHGGGRPANAQTRTVTDWVLDDAIGVRAAGMGQTGVSDNSDPANIYFNAANVVASPRVYLRGAIWDLIPNWSRSASSVGSVGGSWSGSRGATPLAFGVDFTTAKFETGEEIRTIYLPEGTGQMMSPEYFWALTTGAGAVLQDRWDVRLGVAVKRYWNDERDGFGFDVGTTVAYHAAASGWRITPAAAMAFVNLGPAIEETDNFVVELPSRFHYGLSVRMESPTVQIEGTRVPLLTITCNLDGVDRFYGQKSSWGFGSEFSLAEILFLRVGAVHDEQLRDWQTAASPFSSLGLGLAMPVESFRLRFDYARLPRFLDQDRYGLTALVAF